MKLKFNADPKDWKMFGIYAVILLYFIAIAVLNLSQFAIGDTDHLFYGFSPFKAFTGGYLPVTLTLYIIALIASLFLVDDKFFDRSKGFGFGTETKTDKGYSRWLSESELKRDSDIVRVKLDDEVADAGGVPLINNGKYMWVDNGGFHNIIIGSTGAGKSQITMFPLIKSLAKHDESMIITDPKGELYEGTSKLLKKRGYNVIVLNFRDPQRGSGWNPLHLPYIYYKQGNTDKANELIDDLAINILYDANAQQNDPFWEKTSADYFSGICLGLFEDAKEEEINLNSVNMFTTVGEEKARPNATYVQEYFKTKDPTSSAYVSASSTLIAPNDTRGSILSVFKQKLRLFASRDNISEMLSHSDFEFTEIGSKKTAVFIVIQDEKKTYHPLVTIFVKQCYEALVDFAQKSGGKLPYRTNFLLDEFANMPPLKDVETMVSAARSRKMRFFFVIQNFAQLAEVYGKNKADTIRGNCGNIIYLISTEIAALEEISKMCGEIKVKTGSGDKEKEETRPLITVSDLQKLKMGEVILLRSRNHPFRTKLKLDHELDWGELYNTSKQGSEAYPHREKQKVKVFDLKGFVNAAKTDKINQIMNNVLGKTSEKTPIPSMSGLTPRKSNRAVDVSKLMERVDKKIAELEAEQKSKLSKLDENNSVLKNKLEEKPKEIKQSINKQPKEIVKPINKQKKEAIKTHVSEEIKPVSKNNTIEKPAVKKTTKRSTSKEKKDFADKITARVNFKMKNQQNSYVSDDQFFDDFFADDDY